MSWLTDMCKTFAWVVAFILTLSIAQTYTYNQDYETPEYEMRAK